MAPCPRETETRPGGSPSSGLLPTPAPQHPLDSTVCTGCPPCQLGGCTRWITAWPGSGSTDASQHHSYQAGPGGSGPTPCSPKLPVPSLWGCSRGSIDGYPPACWGRAAAWRAWCGCRSGCSSPAGPQCWEQRARSILVSCRGRGVSTSSQPPPASRVCGTCHPDLSCHLHPNLLYAWLLR